MDISRAVADLRDPRGNPVPLRMGIAAGPVVAGVVGARRFFYDVWGDAVNVASRMEALARPNRLFVGPLTYQAIQGKFKMKSIGTVEIRGRTEPVQVYEVVRSP